jgi:hypothetical protein
MEAVDGDAVVSVVIYTIAVMCMILMWYCCEMLGIMVVVATSRERTCACKLQLGCWLLASASLAPEVDRARKPRWKHERQFPG